MTRPFLVILFFGGECVGDEIMPSILRCWGAALLTAGVTVIATSLAGAQRYEGCFINGQRVPDCMCSGGCENENPQNYTPRCAAGEVLTPDGGCMPAGATDCGGDQYCKSGERCTPTGCVPVGALDCGNGTNCNRGSKCAIGGGCIPADTSDCGNGRNCSGGTKCVWDGSRTGECVSASPAPPDAPRPVKAEVLKSDMDDVLSDFRNPERHTGEKKWNRRTNMWETFQDTPKSWAQRLATALGIVAAPWIAVGDTASVVQAKLVMDQFKQELKQREKEILRDVIRQMIADTNRLESFNWDTPLQKQEKLKVVLATQDELRRLQTAGLDELDNLPTIMMGDTSGSRFHILFKPGVALQRIEEIHRTGHFWD